MSEPVVEPVETREDRIRAEADRIIAMGECSEMVAPYDVHPSTIGTWLDAMDYQNPRFRDGDEAPPSMYQVWTMPGLGRRRAPEDPLSRITDFLTAEGYSAVLGTNCEQTYERYLKVGERPRVTNALESVSGPKSTAMGVGYFVTSRNVWYVDHPDGLHGEVRAEKVAEMLFRLLKFVPELRAEGERSEPSGRKEKS